MSDKGFVLILGAKSDMAQSIAREYAGLGFNLYLAARNVAELESLQSDLQIRHQVEVRLLEWDALKLEEQSTFYQGLTPAPVGVVTALGFLGDQTQAQQDAALAQKILQSNFNALVAVLEPIAADFEQKKSGFIVGISSVAGDRGRKANYIYGSAKAGFTAYLSGLRNRLAEVEVQVLTVKPGFVATKMTAGMDLPEKLTAQPEQVAKMVVKAQQKGRNVIYVKPVWWLVMLIIRHIPEAIFKKMSI
ncbi:SDR family oxidoreductase [Thiomicrorhabdus xiamenensis]|uniref:SDR family oxidoreductase n=1 Tax=Thiomicrorhabdus xiamenensis TaxID=2739063 RepID=A0A7D4NM10_9GAMM|nr:SDR family oxidoreductase [Thiomicrorhabdus xiamenensis]QKI89754.1 SDR family oxidoreductase [Thiomicrorhabdus xiamenensis]